MVAPWQASDTEANVECSVSPARTSSQTATFVPGLPVFDSCVRETPDWFQISASSPRPQPLSLSLKFREIETQSTRSQLPSSVLNLIVEESFEASANVRLRAGMSQSGPTAGFIHRKMEGDGEEQY